MQSNNKKTFKSFSVCVANKITKMADRAIAFLYFRAVKNNSGATIKQIICDFEAAGLGKPNITNLRKVIRKDKRTVKAGKDQWRLRADKIRETEIHLSLLDCLKEKKSIIVTNRKNRSSNVFVDNKRVTELKKIKSSTFDLCRLIKMITELNDAFSKGNYISVILLVRAILDHVPPIFNCNYFSEIANNYKSAKSFKESMLNLENSSRKIADSYLHIKIRKKEVLPNKTQVNFSNDLDVLLAEIVRIS